MGMGRRWWRSWHLLLALVAGAPLALVAATGVLMNFWFATDALLDPGFYPPRAEGAAVPLDVQLDSVRARAPGTWVSGLFLIEGGRVTHVWVADSADGPVVREYAVDPRSGRVLADRAPGDAVINEAYRLHSALFLGDGGRTLVSVLAVVLLALLVSGVVLAWRRDGWAWVWPRFRRGRRWWDVHQGLGTWSAAVLGLAAGTAVLLQVVAVMKLTEQPEPAAAAASVADGRGPPALPLEVLAARAREVAGAPGYRLVALLPVDGAGPLEAVLERPATMGSRRMLRRVVLDKASGAVVAEGPRNPAATLLVELHTGYVGGTVGRVVMAGAGLVVVVLWVSGLVLWGQAVGRRGVGEGAA